MSEPGIRHRYLHSAPATCALGSILAAGEILDGRGVEPRGRLRRYGSFAVMIVTNGSGHYRDADGLDLRLPTGSVVTVTPGHAHWYGPDLGERWDERYVTFDGPVFDLLRADGTITPDRPVAHPGSHWADALDALLGDADEGAQRCGSAVARVATLLGLLAELAPTNVGATHEQPRHWLDVARHLLDSDLDVHRSIDAVAAAVHVHPDTLRRSFRQRYGESPARYRSRRRVEAVKQLLRFSPDLTNHELASMLGYSDEFHLSHAFRRITGEPPQAFRRSLADQPQERDS